MTQTDICTHRHSGSETSAEAFRTTPESCRNRQRSQVLELLQERGGMTTEEVSLELGIAYTAASARMSELKRDSAIVDSGERRLTTHGKKARVMEAV